MKLCRTKVILSWLLQLITAAILAQTLFFKFSGSEESIYIFSTLGIEPWGRIGTGLLELVAVMLLLTPRTVTMGALLSLGLISGAIFSHLTKLGVVVKDDGGLLFALAVVVFVFSSMILWIRRTQIPVIGRFFTSNRITISCQH